MKWLYVPPFKCFICIKRPTPSTPQADTEKHSGNEEELNSFSQKSPLFLLVILLLAICLVTEAQQQCHPSRRIRGRKAAPGQCNQKMNPDLW